MISRAGRLMPALLVLGAAVAIAAFGEERGQASSRTPLGQVIGNPELPALSGGKRAPEGGEAVSVLFFFRPDGDYNKATLLEMASCEQRLAGKPVGFTAIVSSRYPPEQIKGAVAAAALAMPVLLDEGDAFAASLAVAQLPAVAITDREHRLVAYQPFAKINFCELVNARVRRALGEIGDAELQAILNPEATKMASDASVAQRHIKMAERLLRSGHADKALESAKAAVEQAPRLASAHSVLGACLLAQGKCGEALPAFEKALELDVADARALEGKKACQAKP